MSKYVKNIMRFIIIPSKWKLICEKIHKVPIAILTNIRLEFIILCVQIIFLI